MRQRLNISLSEETVQLIDRMAKRGNRSRLITEAVIQYADRLARTRLRGQLKEGALRRAGRDLLLAQEWCVLEEEAWQKRRA